MIHLKEYQNLNTQRKNEGEINLSRILKILLALD